MVELAALPSTNEEIERAEAALLGMDESEFLPVECPLVHRFAPGIYMRQITMFAGLKVIGHRHLFAHLNVVTEGRALVNMNGTVTEIVAPCIFVSEPGVRKILQIEETMVFCTIHPNPDDETAIEVLESRYIEKSATYLQHEEDQRAFLELEKSYA